MSAAERRMSTESDSVKIEYLYRSVRSVEEALKVLPAINAQLERQKLQDEHFKENQARMQNDINRLYNKLEDHEKDDRKSFEIISEKLNTLDAKPGKIALSRNEKWIVAIVLVVLVAMGNSWIQLQKLEARKTLITAQK